MGSFEIVEAEFKLGLECKEVARKSLDDLRFYLQAAEHLGKAGELSLQEAANTERDQTTRLQAETCGHYYLAEQMACLATFHYEQRQAALAAKEHQQAIDHLTQSIAVGESALSKVPEEIALKLKKNIDFNKFMLQHEEIAVMSSKARDALDRKDLVTALDWYRRIFQRTEQVIETSAAYDPSYERISKGNLYGSMANAHQAYAHICMKNFGHMNDETHLGTSTQDIGDEVFQHLYLAYKSGKEALRANPEWRQYAQLSAVLLSQIRELLSLNKPAWPAYLRLTAIDPQIATIMEGLDMALFKKIQSEQIQKAVDDNTPVRTWLAVSSFTTATVAIGLVVYVIVTGVTHWWQGFLGLAAWETMTLIIGGLTLRTVGTLSEAHFVDLMKLAVNQQFKLFQSYLQTAKDAFSAKPKSKASSIAKKPADKTK
jgi:Lon protease-like protein